MAAKGGQGGGGDKEATTRMRHHNGGGDRPVIPMRGDSSIMKSTGGEEDGDASDEENSPSFLLPGQTHGLEIWNDGEPNNPFNPTLTCASVRLWAPAVRLWGPGQRHDRAATERTQKCATVTCCLMNNNTWSLHG
uniref:Uncharacterized protein n=1 Tax=Oryza meridionalis TaxID=40149 RepID=A0A0E0EU85_9ORYZ